MSNPTDSVNLQQGWQKAVVLTFVNGQWEAELYSAPGQPPLHTRDLSFIQRVLKSQQRVVASQARRVERMAERKVDAQKQAEIKFALEESFTSSK